MVPTSDEIRFAGGFFAEEQDGSSAFRWTGLHAIIEFDPSTALRFLECELLSGMHGLSQVVTVDAGSETRAWPLRGGWTLCSIPVPAGGGRAELRINHRVPGEWHAGDNRVLGIRVRNARLHRDPARHPANNDACCPPPDEEPEPMPEAPSRQSSESSASSHSPATRTESRIARWFARPKNWLDREEDSLIPPRRLWIGKQDSITHYTRWIWEYLAYLTIVVGLERQDTVLELGCGHGRLARGLLTYLRWPGRYVGLDVNAAAIADAQSRLTPRFRNFEFVLADVLSREYSPVGKSHASTYVFPFDRETFDVAYAGSLFTHLLPDETENYFKESRRVLKPHGRCLFSAFVLDFYRGPGTATSPHYAFDHAFPGWPGVAVANPTYPDAAIAYNLETLTTLAERADLHIERVMPGLWTDSTTWATNEQDLLVLVPGARPGAPPVVGGFGPPRS